MSTKGVKKIRVKNYAADDGERDLSEIIDEAGDFLIQEGNYSHGLNLYRAAVKRFPEYVVFLQGIGILCRT